jgi:hypothetical protein
LSSDVRSPAPVSPNQLLYETPGVLGSAFFEDWRSTGVSGRRHGERVILSHFAARLLQHSKGSGAAGRLLGRS